MVERRDQVFTTFFSFRAFSASTFSRRWSSMNGPFLSERGIVLLLLLNPAQLDPLRAPHLAKTAHRPGTRCDSGQNGHTNRVPCAFGIFSTITAHPALQNRYSTWAGGASHDTVFTTGFTARRGTALPRRALACAGRAGRREASRLFAWLS